MAAGEVLLPNAGESARSGPHAPTGPAGPAGPTSSSLRSRPSAASWPQQLTPDSRVLRALRIQPPQRTASPRMPTHRRGTDGPRRYPGGRPRRAPGARPRRALRRHPDGCPAGPGLHHQGGGRRRRPARVRCGSRSASPPAGALRLPDRAQGAGHTGKRLMGPSGCREPPPGVPWRRAPPADRRLPAADGREPATSNPPSPPTTNHQPPRPTPTQAPNSPQRPPQRPTPARLPVGPSTPPPAATDRPTRPHTPPPAPSARPHSPRATPATGHTRPETHEEAAIPGRDDRLLCRARGCYLPLAASLSLEPAETFTL